MMISSHCTLSPPPLAPFAAFFFLRLRFRLRFPSAVESDTIDAVSKDSDKSMELFRLPLAKLVEEACPDEIALAIGALNSKTLPFDGMPFDAGFDIAFSLDLGCFGTTLEIIIECNTNRMSVKKLGKEPY